MASKSAKLAITRERSIILQIQELIMTIEAYRNSYLHFIDPSAAVAVYTDRQRDRRTHTHTHTHTNTLPYRSTSLAHVHRGIITEAPQKHQLESFTFIRVVEKYGLIII